MILKRVLNGIFVCALMAVSALCVCTIQTVQAEDDVEDYEYFYIGYSDMYYISDVQNQYGIEQHIPIKYKEYELLGSEFYEAENEDNIWTYGYLDGASFNNWYSEGAKEFSNDIKNAVTGADENDFFEIDGRGGKVSVVNTGIKVTILDSEFTVYSSKNINSGEGFKCENYVRIPKLTIQKETENNQTGEFKFRIKAWMDRTVSNFLKIGSISHYILEADDYHMIVGDNPIVIDGYTFEPGREYRYYARYQPEEEWDLILEEYINQLESNLGQDLKKGDLELTQDGYVVRKAGLKITYDGQEYDSYHYGKGLIGGDVPTSHYIKLGEETQREYIEFDYEEGFEPTTEDPDMYEFTLKNGEAIKTTYIPPGYHYTIEELTPEGWRLVSIDGKSASKVDTTSTDTKVTHTFLNSNDSKPVPTSTPTTKKTTTPVVIPVPNTETK